jgi:signal transduction histidine kinase
MRSVVDTLTVYLKERGNGRVGLIAAELRGIPETPILLAYSVVYNRGGTARSVFGFITKPTAFSELFARWYGREPLLPPSIAGEEPNDSLLHVAVYAPGDGKVFESGVAYPLTYAARDSVGPEYGGLIVETAVRPDAASHLIIGGLPRSRLPIIFGLLLVTLSVGVAALFQIRREHQLARLRDDFVSGVSHELRTPLAQIRMFAELLDEGKLRTDSERKRSMKVINREARRLTHLVENVLQYSRLRRAPGGMAVERTDVAVTVGEVIDVFRPLAESLDIQISKEIDGVPVALADRDCVKQILLNLLDNALKYGPSGQVITIGAGHVGDEIRLFVQDEGPGIPASDRARIWEPYYRLEDNANGGAAGTGIGLAVVEKLASLHNGKAWVEETPEAGARFVVQLPAAEVDPGTGAS